MNRNQTRLRRKNRSQIKGTKAVPRLSVFKSLTKIEAQLVDDQSGKTILALTSKKVDKKKFDLEVAQKMGLELAKMAKGKKVAKVVFDRGGYKYHGKIKAFADGAREGGLKF